MGQKVYRYVLTDTISPNTPACNCNLVTTKFIAPHNTAIRVAVTKDMRLEKNIMGYYETESRLPLKEYKPVIVVKINNVWVVDRILTVQWRNSTIQPHDFSTELRKRGYQPVDKFGYITHNQLSYWNNNHDAAQTLNRLPKDEELERSMYNE